ncbi:MAG TPA: hypothetical protein VI160_05165, partial [Gemmatimonadales bacterium]
WITVQPHFHDLVVATYGRGFWILDDVSALEPLDATALAGKAFFFAPRSAYRFRGGQGITDAPNSAVTAENAPYGADLDYLLPAALADTSASPDTTHRRRPIRLTITDASGALVRTLEGTRKLGINRVWWDLRWNAPAVARLRTPPPGKSFVRVGPDGTRPLVAWDLDLSERGPLVLPGTYTVKLALGDTTLTQTVTVLKDPNSAGTEADVQAQSALALTIRGEQDSVVRMINRLEWVRKQLEDLSGQLHADSALAGDSAARRFASRADSLDKQAIAVEGALFDVHLTGAREDPFRTPTQLFGRLAALQSDVAENSADFAPTAQQVAVNDLFKQRIADASTRFAELMDKDVPAFGSALGKAGLKDVIARTIDTGR